MTGAVALDLVLAGARGDLQFSLERAADEGAADPPIAPLWRAPWRSRPSPCSDACLHAPPGFAFHRHGLTDRLAAMLDEPNRRSRPAWTLLAVALAAALDLAWAPHDTERFVEAVEL